jgi:2-C-methyl-D-erythritol 2,4-cyclodiphosphate synthase
MDTKRVSTLKSLTPKRSLEKPKLNPHIPEMQEIIAQILKVENDCVSIKATTHEKVDSFGERKAVKAYAVCLLNKN